MKRTSNYLANMRMISSFIESYNKQTQEVVFVDVKKCLVARMENGWMTETLNDRIAEWLNG